jgi:hypothetical protein
VAHLEVMVKNVKKKPKVTENRVMTDVWVIENKNPIKNMNDRLFRM